MLPGLDFDYGFTKFSLVISLSNSGGENTVFVTLSVLPVNEAAPVFVTNPVNVTWSEDTPLGTVLAIVSATDEDAYSHGTVTYAVLNGNYYFTIAWSLHVC